VCDGSRQTEQEQQHEVQGPQGQDLAWVVQQQQPPSGSSSVRDGCSASAVCHTAEVVEAVQAADVLLEGAVGGSISTSGSGCRGSRTTPDLPSLVSLRLSHSSIGSVTEASSSSSCAAGQQQQQHLSAELGVRATDVCGNRQTEHEEQSEAPSLQGQDGACEGQDIACVGKQLQAMSAVSNSNGSSSCRSGCSAAAACYHSSSTPAALIRGTPVPAAALAGTRLMTGTAAHATGDCGTVAQPARGSLAGGQTRAWLSAGRASAATQPAAVAASRAIALSSPSVVTHASS
jgi:hypothetical protein